MCTAITFQSKDFYVGRTLDHTRSYTEEVTVTPRNFPLEFRHMDRLDHHYAIIGMAYVADNYPLYYDGMNEKGLAIAGLNFVGNARYRKPEADAINVAQFELIPWLLGTCASVAEVREQLKNLCITNTPFSPDLPPAQLHWLIADRNETITVEAVKEGLRIYDNPVGVLTNNPPFDEQMFQLNNFMHLSPKAPHNHFFPQLPLQAYSYGMGALGLPGDLSSQSRFVRAAFNKLNARAGASEEESVGQFFHVLGSVEQIRGCNEVEEGVFEITVYTSCCNTDKGIYYYTTYQNRRITAVHLHREALDGASLVRYPLLQEEQVYNQN